MRIIFMGSGELACPVLESLFRSPECEIVGVVTQPDRPKGRRLKISPCPVKTRVTDAGVPLFSPLNVNTDEAVDGLRRLAPDLVVVVAYGQILRQQVLEIPAQGCINVHASLLPEYRGAAPIQWSIADCRDTTGVTIMYMDRGMDTGDIIAQRSTPILPTDTSATLEARLAVLGGELLLSVLAACADGSATRRPQDHEAATYARKLVKQDGKIDWSWPAAKIECRVRAFTPWPTCFCGVDGPRKGMRLRVLGAAVEDGVGAPGTVIDIGKGGPLVATGRQAVRLLEVQPEGRKPMSGAAYLCGNALEVGDRFI